MSIGPIERQSTADLVLGRMLELMSSGALRVGERLPTERDLAERFQVARSSVREALQRIESMGLTRSKPGAGTFVQSVSLRSMFDRQRTVAAFVELDGADLEDILQARRAIEQETAAAAASLATPQDKAVLAEALQEGLLHRREPATFVIEHDLRFHVALAEASGNCVYPLIVRLLRDLYLKSDLAVKLADVPGLIDHSLHYHALIYSAVADGDSDRARAAMTEHLSYNRNLVLKIRGLLPPPLTGTALRE